MIAQTAFSLSSWPMTGPTDSNLISSSDWFSAVSPAYICISVRISTSVRMETLLLLLTKTMPQFSFSDTYCFLRPFVPHIENLFLQKTAGQKTQNGSRHGNGRKHGNQNAQGQSQREALNNACAQPEQNGASDQRRNIGIANGRPSTGKAFAQSAFKILAPTQFFFDSFKDQNVGVHR